MQYHHGESFLGQNSAAPPGSWLSHRLPGSTGPTAAGVGSTSSSTIPGIPATNPSFVDTGLSPPPSSNNSNVAADEQPQLKPLHINNNIPSSYPNSTSTGQHVNTNTPTPPSSAEAISPSSVSSGKPPFFSSNIQLINIISVSGDSIFIFKICQTVEGTCMTTHFHDFLR